MSTKEEPEIICAVCECYDPHAWKKNVCRNCFHPEEAHGGTQHDSSTENKDTKCENKVENKSDPKQKEASKPKEDKKLPTTLPKTGLKGKELLGKSAGSGDKQDDSTGTVKKEDSKDKAKTDTSVKLTETEKDSKKLGAKVSVADKFKQNIENKQKSKVGINYNLTKKTDKSTEKSDEKCEVQSSTTTSSSLKDTGSKGNIEKSTGSTKAGKKLDDAKKDDVPAETKVFTNSKLAGSALLLQDKTKLGEKANLKQDKNRATETTDATKDTVSESTKDKLCDSKSDKIKLLSKSFAKKESDNKFNSLDRKKFEKKDNTLHDNKFASLERKKPESKETNTTCPQTPTDEKKADIKTLASTSAAGLISKFGTRAAEGSSNLQQQSAGEKNTSSTVPSTKDAGKNVSKLDNKFKFGASKFEKASKEANDRVATLVEEKSKVNGDLEQLHKKLSEMESKCQKLEGENTKLRSEVNDKEKADAKLKMQKQDVENLIKELRASLTNMESRCCKLETDNSSLMGRLKEQEHQQQEQQKQSTDEETSNAIRDIGVTVIEREGMLQDLQDENSCLQQEIKELKMEMDEMYDSFREQEAEEFREIQHELEITAKNCRILQFKLRKAERRNDQIESDRKDYEEKLHMLQNQFEDQDARAHIRSLEDELQMAKEVSVRLHDELDILDERRSKVEEENKHLTEILEKSDKKQFRLEMEIDRLKEQIYDLKTKLTSQDGGSDGSEEITDRRAFLGRLSAQNSQEQDTSQLTKDLLDSLERETDLKDQLKFMEDEARSHRKKIEELEDENDNLSIQLKKMSVAHASLKGNSPGSCDKDSEELVELKIQMELNEQELMVSRKKIHDMENEAEKLQNDVKRLTCELQDKDVLLSVMPEPSSPNSYYEDKMKEVQIELDELRWKLIEKEREIERLEAQAVVFSRQNKLRRSRSMETNFDQISDMRKQVDVFEQENKVLRARVNRLQTDVDIAKEKNKALEEKLTDCSKSEPSVCFKCKQSFDCDKSTISPMSNIEKNSLPLSNAEAYAKAFEVNSAVPSIVFTEALETNFSSGTKSVPSVEIISDENDTMAPRNIVSDLETKIQILEKENIELKTKIKNVTKESHSQNTAFDEVKKSDSHASRDHLMDQILDMEDEIESLTKKLKERNEEINTMHIDIQEAREELDKVTEEASKRELDLMAELELAHDKSNVLSNLLDIVKERADDAEEQLEKLFAKESCRSTASGRSARVVSALSDVSSGSDDVFDGASNAGSIPGSPEVLAKSKVIHKDWENQFKKRVDCLEHLLAEERQKVATYEKKLLLASTETLSSAMSDDAKLHKREKELLQSDVIESKKLLKIANDQIKGLRERIESLEEVNRNLLMSSNRSDFDEDKTPCGSIDTVVDATDAASTVASPIEMKPRTPSESEAEYIALYNECELRKSTVERLQLRLTESEAEWKKKHNDAEKEKAEVQIQMEKMAAENENLVQIMQQLKEEDIRKQKLLKEREDIVNEKVSVIQRKEEMMADQEDIIRERETDLQMLLDQISVKDDTIRKMRENLKSRDECINEKDEMLAKNNSSARERDEEIAYFNEELNSLQDKLKEKDDTIVTLEGQLRDLGNEKSSDVKTENIRLKSDLDSMADNLGKMHTDKCMLQTEIEKAKQALSEAMVLWNKDRAYLEKELNIALGKLNMFEGNKNKKESDVVQNLRKDAQKFLEHREKLSSELRMLKVESEANIRTLKNEKLKLQEELTQKIRQLTSEMTSNDKMSQELERLRAQEDIAYQIQHHEKLLRAEYLAMKVRYETRLENLQKDHMNLLQVLDNLQREKVLNKEIIRGVQKGMSTMKETYAKDVSKWTEEKEMLTRHIEEVEESRRLAKDLQLKVEELKNQLADQEYERAELVNKMTSERATWEVERANMQSKINQLTEKFELVNQAHSSTKTMQNRMEVAWEKERAEHKRLLSEAHSLALDLQGQLKKRDDEHARERRALLEQLKRLRTEIDEEQLQRDVRIKQIEERDRIIKNLEQRLQDLEERTAKDHESSVRDRADLARRLGEMRKQYKRAQRKLEEILSSMTRLKELGAIIVDSELKGENSISENELLSRLNQINSKPLPELEIDKEHPAKDHMQFKMTFDQAVLKHIKDSLKEIVFAVEDLGKPRELSDEEKKSLRRSLSSSEIDFLMKEDFGNLKKDSWRVDSPKPSPLTVQNEDTTKYRRSITQDDATQTNTSFSDILPEIHGSSITARQKSIMDAVHEQGVQLKFPSPPPSFLIPRSHNNNTSVKSETTVKNPGDIKKLTTTQNTRTTVTQSSFDNRHKLGNPPLTLSISKTVPKVSSVQASPDGNVTFPMSKSVSAGATPTTELTNPMCSIPIGPSPSSNFSPPTSGTSSISSSSERLTPKTARRKFFEETVRSKSVPTPPKLWPTKSSSQDNVAVQAVTNPVWSSDGDTDADDSDFITRELEKTKPRLINQSKSFDDHSCHAIAPMTKQTKDSDTDTEEKPCSKKKKVVHRAQSVDMSHTRKTKTSNSSHGTTSSTRASDIFATMKRKLRSLKRSASTHEDDAKVIGNTSTSSNNHETPCDNSNPQLRLTIEDSFGPPPPTPPISAMDRKTLPVVTDVKGPLEPPRLKSILRVRSKSAERAPKGATALQSPEIKQDFLSDAHVTKSFNETSV